MKPGDYTPPVLFGVLCIAFVVYVGLSAAALPDRLATHFDASGNPNGWMTKAAYVPFISLMGLALPLFILGLTFLTRFLPERAINLPHKDYWLSPEQRAATNAFFLRHTFWMGCLLLILMGGLHFLTVKANQSSPVRLPGSQFAVLMGAFLGGMAVWIIALIRRFRKPPTV